jgi:MFS family permease
MRYGLFAADLPTGFVLLGLSLHGLAYTFFYPAAYIYLDTQCRPGERASAQQLFTLVYAGAGNLAGSFAAGYADGAFAGAGVALHYLGYWGIAGAGALAVGVFLAAAFREAPAHVREPAEDAGG